MTKEEIRKLQERIIKDINNMCKIDKNKIEYDKNNNIVINEINNIYRLSSILDRINEKYKNNIKFEYEIYDDYDKVYIYYTIFKYNDRIVFKYHSKKAEIYSIKIVINKDSYMIYLIEKINIYKNYNVLKDKNELEELKKESNNIIIEYILNEYLNNNSEYIESNIDNYKNIIKEIIYS